MTNQGYYIASYHDDDGKVYQLKRIEGNEALSLLYTLYILKPEIEEWQNEHKKHLDTQKIFVEWVSEE